MEYNAARSKLSLREESAFYRPPVEPLGITALQIDQSYIYIGTEATNEGLSIFLDFSVLGDDPDSGDPSFWGSPHHWTIMTFATDNWWGLWGIANGTYLSGDFSTSYTPNGTRLYLNWMPTQTKRTLTERLAAQARARLTVKQSAPG
jgi:hypothetical protein